MEDVFGVIVVIICVIAAVAKSRKNPPQRRNGRAASSFRNGNAEQVFQQAFDRLSDKLEPAAKFIDDALPDENGMEVPSARRSAEVFMAQADGEDEEAEQNYDGSLGNPAANGGADRAAFAARDYAGSLGNANGNARMARDYGGSLNDSAGMRGSLGNPAANGGANRAAQNAAPGAKARDYAGSLGAAPALTREPLATGMSRADAEGCLGGSLSGHSEEGESRAEHAEHLRRVDAQERAILRGEERALHMRSAARTELRRAVVWSEILDKPKALRRR